MSDSEEKYLCALLDGAQQVSSQHERDRLVTDSLDLLAANSQHKETVRQQHLVKSLLRGETDGLTKAMASGDLHQRIMAAVADEAGTHDQAHQLHESSVAAARVVAGVENTRSDRVVALRTDLPNTTDSIDTINSDASTSGPGDSSPGTTSENLLASNDDVTWWKPAAAFAVAASVVAMAVFTWYPAEIVPNNITGVRAPVEIANTIDSTTSTNSGPINQDTVLDEEAVFLSAGTRWASVSADDGRIIVDSAVDTAGQSYLNMLLVEHGSATSMNGLSSYAKFVGFDVSSSR